MDQTKYDAIVIGTGVSGGWAAKELCEKGLKTLVLERGRMLKHVEDYTTMNDQHWDIINFLRDYYQEYQIAPAVKVLTKAIAKRNEMDKKEASSFLYELFPNGPGLQACKIAGLPKPTGCV